MGTETCVYCDEEIVAKIPQDGLGMVWLTLAEEFCESDPVGHMPRRCARRAGSRPMSDRRDEAVRTGACDHEVGICWGKPLPTPAEVEAVRHAECSHPIGVCRVASPWTVEKGSSQVIAPARGASSETHDTP